MFAVGAQVNGLGSAAAIGGVRCRRVAKSRSPAAAAGNKARHGLPMRLRAMADEDEGGAPSGGAPSTPPPAASSSAANKKVVLDAKVIAVADTTATLIATVVARAVANQDVASAGTVAAFVPFFVGWVGAAAFAGDYSNDEPNAAVQGDVVRAASTAGFTWFSGCAIAIFGRRIYSFPPVVQEEVQFGLGLALLIGLRAAVVTAANINYANENK